MRTDTPNALSMNVNVGDKTNCLSSKSMSSMVGEGVLVRMIGYPIISFFGFV